MKILRNWKIINCIYFSHSRSLKLYIGINFNKYLISLPSKYCTIIHSPNVNNPPHYQDSNGFSLLHFRLHKIAIHHVMSMVINVHMRSRIDVFICILPCCSPLVVSGHYKVCAVPRDNNNIAWTTEYRRLFLYIPSYDVILAVNENVNVNVNVVAVLNPETGSELQSICLPDSVRDIRVLCLFKNQIIVACEAWGGNISYFNLK